LSESHAFIRELEQLGEEEVRRRVARGDYALGDKGALAQHWLAQFDRERTGRVVTFEEARRIEEVKIARDALEVSRIAPDATRGAKNPACIAAVAAVLSVVVSIAALWVSLSR
jgi:hypothetical protein